MTLVQQGFRTGTGGGGGGGLTNLTIQNTLYVAKNGNDATGLPDRLDKPYLTIYGATQNASAGDTIYVFAGDYNEGSNDIFADNVYYVLQAGVIVTCNSKVVSDYGVARTINISGEGVLQTNFGGNSAGTIYITEDSTLNLTCKEIRGKGKAIVCGGNFNINAKYLYAETNIGITITDILGSGGKSYGSVNIDVVDVPSGVSSLKVDKANNDLQERNIYLNFNEIKGSTSKGSPLMLFNLTNLSKIYLNATNVYQNGLERIGEIQDSQVFINNSNLQGIQGGIIVQDSVLYMTNSNIVSATTTFICNSGSTQINNTYIKATGTQAISISNDAELFMCDCVIAGGSNGGNVISLANAPFLRIKNCQIIAIIPTTTYCISSVLANDIYVYGQCSANKPTNATLTNQVAGTNIVVDADIIENTFNFF